MGKQIQCVFGLIFLLVLMSCENDLYNDTFRQKGLKIKLSAYSAKSADGLRNTNLNAEMAKLRDKGRLAGRPVYDSVYNIWFDDENGVKIEAGDYKSFTFPAKKEDSEQLINILFKELPNGEYETMLVKYNISAEEFKTLPKENYPTLEPEFERVLYNDGYLTIEHFCEPTWQEQEGFYDDEGSNVGDEDQYPDGVPTQMVFVGLNCYYVYTFASGGGGGNSNPTPPDNGENPGGNFGPGSPNVITTPLPEYNELCQSLNAVSEALNLPSHLNAFRNGITSNPHGEDGASLTKVNGSYGLVPLPTSHETTITINVGSTIFGAIHTHNDKLSPIFSFADLLQLLRLYTSYTGDKHEVVFILTPPTGNSLAIKTDQPWLLTEFINSKLNNCPGPPDKKMEAISKQFDREIEKNDGVDKNIIKGFLRAANGAGISLFKLNSTGWEKLQLENDDVKSIKCK